MFKIKNLTTKAEMYIYGLIIDDTDANWLLQDDDGKVIGYQYPADIKAQLDALKGLPIDVHIASDGGDVAAGIAIYNMLVNHDAPVTVYIDSWAASIASVIAMAGSKIIMPANTFLMIHNPKGGGFGEADYLRSIADWLDKLKEMLVNTYVEHVDLERYETNKDVATEVITDAMDKETWYTAEEASRVFKNVELVESNDIKAVAQYKSKFSGAPDVIKATDVKNNILKLLQEAYRYEEESGVTESD